MIHLPENSTTDTDLGIQAPFLAREQICDAEEDENLRNRWSSAIDTLLDWYRSPETLGDDDAEPPSRPVIERALRLALTMRDGRMPAPSRVVLNGEGGLCFERRFSDFFEAIEIEKSGPSEYRLFRGDRLVRRDPLAAGPR